MGDSKKDDLVSDTPFDAFLEKIFRWPGMFVGGAHYDMVAAYVEGADYALRELGPERFWPLEGFHEWLDLHFKKRNSLHWILRAIDSQGLQTDEEKLNRLHELLTAFRSDVHKKGLAAIRQAHERRFPDCYK